MEVHKHPHHVTHKKKWGEYLLEFFMLFFAVFLGFLAENLRETIIEKSKEKEYVASMVEDLKQDSIKIHDYLPFMQTLERGLDTLVQQCYLYNKGEADTRLMYYGYHFYCRGWRDLKLYDKTLVQLKNSGNMRLIRPSIADTLARLDEGIQFYNEQLERMLDAQKRAVDFGLNIFDYREYEKANTTNGITDVHDAGFNRISYQPSLLQQDTLLLKEFASRVGFFRNFVLTMTDIDRDASPVIKHYILFLTDHYHLKPG